MKEKEEKKMVLSFNNIMMTQLVQEKPDCVGKKICRSNDQNALKIKFKYCYY